MIDIYSCSGIGTHINHPAPLTPPPFYGGPAWKNVVNRCLCSGNLSPFP
jgi:hypothetical protein